MELYHNKKNVIKKKSKYSSHEFEVLERMVRVRAMVFNVTFYIFQLYHGGNGKDGEANF